MRVTIVGHDHRLGHGRRKGAMNRALTAEMMIMAPSSVGRVEASLLAKTGFDVNLEQFANKLAPPFK